MTIIAAIEAVALVAVVIAFLHVLTILEERHAQERSELASRLQFPDRLPAVAHTEPIVLPEREPDGWNEIGEIRVSDEWLKADG